MGSREESSLLCIIQTARAWVRINPLEEGEMLLSLTAADLALLREASGERDVHSRV